MANAEGAGGKLVSVSETAEKQGGGGGVFGFVISKVEAVDGGVIAACMLLLIMAIALIVAKTRYLNATERANGVFRKRFEAMHEDLVPLAAVKDISPEELTYLTGSPLGRLFEIGLDEVGVREKARGNRPLSAAAINAIRSAVDAQVVTENQKFDRLMVILTIAISGGPFIGLLGTVIGVMSTFGGVAMAGDVNVNAIAPGIAAALLATIAGMACAIPSLFGYNYINSRISSQTDEMRVFADRLVTRLAELASDRAEDAQFAQAAE
jgi:biopolymer transport protein ExbB